MNLGRQWVNAGLLIGSSSANTLIPLIVIVSQHVDVDFLYEDILSGASTEGSYLSGPGGVGTSTILLMIALRVFRRNANIFQSAPDLTPVLIFYMPSTANLIKIFSVEAASLLLHQLTQLNPFPIQANWPDQDKVLCHLTVFSRF